MMRVVEALASHSIKIFIRVSGLAALWASATGDEFLFCYQGSSWNFFVETWVSAGRRRHLRTPRRDRRFSLFDLTLTIAKCFQRKATVVVGEREFRIEL